MKNKNKVIDWEKPIMVNMKGKFKKDKIRLKEMNKIKHKDKIKTIQKIQNKTKFREYMKK